MDITSVELTLPNNRNQKIKCWAKIVFNNMLLVSGIKLFEGSPEDGESSYYIRFPDVVPPLHETNGERIRVPIVNTNDKTFRKNITDAICAEYDKIINQQTQ